MKVKFREFMKVKEREGLRRASMHSYGQTLEWIDNYEKSNEVLDFDDINNLFYKSFWNHFVDGQGYTPNTFGKHIKNLKTFMRWAFDEEMHKNKAFRKFQVTKRHCREPMLNSNDLKVIWDLTLNHDDVVKAIERSENIVLDEQHQSQRFANMQKNLKVLIALYSSGMYPRDLMAFNKSMIIEDRYVRYKRTKRVQGFKEPYCIFLYNDDDLFHFKSVCEEMNGRFNFSISHLYRDIKIILKLAKIKKSITPRSLRKSFASIWVYERGLSVQKAMKLTGHAKEETFRHYLNMTDEDFIRDLEAFHY